MNHQAKNRTKIGEIILNVKVEIEENGTRYN